MLQACDKISGVCFVFLLLHPCDKFGDAYAWNPVGMPEVATWLEELSAWVYVVLIGGWLLQRWARKVANPQIKQGGLDRLHARWPSFTRDELEEFIAAHGGDAEAAGAAVQQQVLSGNHPSLLEVEMTKEDASTRLGCMLAGPDKIDSTPRPDKIGSTPYICVLGCEGPSIPESCSVRGV